jgi:hypothetical protein
MPATVFGDKQFQTVLKEWTRELKKHPETLATDDVIQTLSEHLTDVDCSNYDVNAFRSADWSGMRKFIKFTNLFLETHQISEEEAVTLDETISRVLPGHWNKKELLKQQVIVSESFSEPSKENSLDSDLHKQIIAKQAEMKDHNSQMKEIKRKERRNLIWGNILIYSSVAAIPILVPLILTFAPLVGLAIIGIALGVAIALIGPGLFLFFKTDKMNEGFTSHFEALRKEGNDIKELMKYRDLAREEPFKAFMERMGNAQFYEYFTDPKKIGPLFQLYEVEKQELAIRGQIAAAEQKTALVSDVEKLKSLAPLNSEMLTCIERAERLREELAV